MLPLKILRLGAAGSLSIVLMGSAAAAPPTDSVRVQATAAAKPVIVLEIRLASSGVTNEKLLDAERLAHAEAMTAIEKELAKISPRVERAQASNCNARHCLPALAARRGVEQAILLSINPTDFDGYNLVASSWSQTTGSRENKTSCEYCGGDDLVGMAAKLVRALVVTDLAPELPAMPPDTASPTSGVTRDPAVVLAVPVQPPPVAHPSLLAPTLIGASGVALLASGVSLWLLDGHNGSDCSRPKADAPYCAAYATRAVGQALTGVGAAALVVGGVLFWRAEAIGETHVAIGPGSMSIRGRF